MVFFVAVGFCGCGERDTRSVGTARAPAPSFASAELPLSGGGELVKLKIDIGADGRVTANGKTLSSPADLLPMAIDAAHEDPSVRAWIQASPGVTYGQLMAVIDILKQATISRMAFGFSSSGVP